MWEVLIEGRVLRTNAMNDLLVPSETMALCIAAEFASQQGIILPLSTPLYNLACTAIDTFVTEDLAAGMRCRTPHFCCALRVMSLPSCLAAEDLEAELRATRLAFFDTALATGHGMSSAEADKFMREGEAAALSGTVIPLHAAVAAAKEEGAAPVAAAAAAAVSGLGRNSSGAMTSMAAAGTGKLRDLMLDFLETDTVRDRVFHFQCGHGAW
jgi:hypothetical protein